MNVLCPHCHVLLHPGELEEVAADGGRYLICPECDAPFPAPGTPTAPTAPPPNAEPPDA